MHEANVIPLFPDRAQAKEYTVPAHMPCPDLLCYSLNHDQKQRGLENIAKVREQVKESLLQPLRKQRQMLEARRALTEADEIAAMKKIKKLELQIKRINALWSPPSNS